MKYFLGSYNFFQYVFFMILYMTWVKLAKLTLLTTCVVLTTSSNNIFDSRDNVTFSSLLSIFILFPVFKCWGGGGRMRDRESLKIWQLTALWGQHAISQPLLDYGRKKTCVVRTTHGRRRTLKFICPYNKPFSTKLLTLQGNGKHKQCFTCHALSYSRLEAKL